MGSDQTLAEWLREKEDQLYLVGITRGYEAADYLEKLEADLEVATMKRVRDSDRIQKMEAALVHIYTWYPTSLFNPHQTIKDIKEFARKALEEINTPQECVKKEGES